MNNVFDFTGKPIIRTECVCTSGGSAVFQALMALNKYEKALIVGVEKLSGIENGLVTKAMCSAENVKLYFQEGLIFPA